MRQIAALALLALAGCASTAPAPAPGAAAGEQRAKTLQKAAEYCRKKGLAMQPVKTADTPTRPGQIAPEVEFHCVKARK